MNTPVSFPIAKLMKDKRLYDVPTKLCMSLEDHRALPFLSDLSCGNGMHINSRHPYYSAPTIAEVVMWLYEKYGIWITSEPFIKSDEIVVYIYKIFKNGYVDTISRASTGFNSIDQSYEAGIEYVLKNLI